MNALTSTAAGFCPPSVRRANRALDVELREHHHMDLARWKAIKTTLVSLAIIGLAVFAMLQGADPTLTVAIVVPVVGLVAGIEFSELVAAMAEADGGE